MEGRSGRRQALAVPSPLSFPHPSRPCFGVALPKPPGAVSSARRRCLLGLWVFCSSLKARSGQTAQSWARRAARSLADARRRLRNQIGRSRSPPQREWVIESFFTSRETAAESALCGLIFRKACRNLLRLRQKKNSSIQAKERKLWAFEEGQSISSLEPRQAWTRPEPQIA